MSTHTTTSAPPVGRRVAGTLIAAVSGLVVAGTIAMPAAHAAPCTASGLANTASGVLGSAGAFLDAHPGANDVLTQAANQPTDVARENVRGYFLAHPGEFLELQGIVQPLKDMRAQCGISISAGQLAALFDQLG